MNALALIWMAFGIIGAYASLLWFNFFKKVRELTDTLWVWGFLLPSPVFAFLALYIGFWGLMTGAGSLVLVLGYLLVWFMCLIPVVIWAKTGDKITEWSDLRYTLKSANLVIFSFLNWGRTGGPGDNPLLGALVLIFLPIFPVFTAVFARLKAGISPPKTMYEEREKPGKGLYSTKREVEEE